MGVATKSLVVPLDAAAHVTMASPYHRVLTSAKSLKATLSVQPLVLHDALAGEASRSSTADALVEVALTPPPRPPETENSHEVELISAFRRDT